MKNTQGFKFKLNFRVKDANIDVQKHNFALYRTSGMSIFIYLVVFSPIFAYFSVIYNNVNLDLYFEYYPQFSPYMTLPSHADIYGAIWASFGLMVLVVFLLGFFKPIVTMDGMRKKRQLLFIVGIVVLMVLSLLLASLSQYYYSLFETFFHYESSTTNQKLKWMQELSEKFTANSKAGIDVYGWQSSSIIWWVMFFQLTIIFGSIVFLQNSVFGRNELLGIEQYINYSIKRQGINRSRWTRKIGQLFKVTDKNLSIWLLIITFLIMIPNFAYAILISAKGSSINTLINWTYNLPNLLQDYPLVPTSGGFNDAFKQLLHENPNIHSNFFSLNSLPIITMGLTFSTTFFFISIMLRGGKNSQMIFLTQYIVLTIEIIFLLSFFLYTKLEVEYLYRAWSSDIGLECFEQFKLAVGGPNNGDYQKILGLFPIADIIGKKFGKMNWWSQYEIIAEAIIGVSFAVCSLLAVGLGVARSNQITKEFLREKSLIKLVGAIKNAG